MVEILDLKFGRKTIPMYYNQDKIESRLTEVATMLSKIAEINRENGIANSGYNYTAI